MLRPARVTGPHPVGVKMPGCPARAATLGSERGVMRLILPAAWPRRCRFPVERSVSAATPAKDEGPRARPWLRPDACFPMLAPLRGRGSGAMTARRATALRRGSRVARNAAFGPERSVSGPNLRESPGTRGDGRRRSARPVAVSPCKPQGFAARDRSPHTREVAGSNPAAPIVPFQSTPGFFGAVEAPLGSVGVPFLAAGAGSPAPAPSQVPPLP
jgi:hypothetical protein